MFTGLVDTIKNIPGAVWAAVVSALFTLITVRLTERGNVKRTREQRAHDAEEKARDRTMTLRREVYLPVLAEYNSAISFLSTMPRHSIDDIGKAEPLHKFSTAAAKFGLVSSPAAALAVHRLSTECGLIYLRFGRAAIDIAQVRNAIQVRDEILAKHIEEMNRVNAAMVAINESAKREEARFAALVRQHAAIKTMYDDKATSRDVLMQQQAQLHNAYGRDFLIALKAVLDVGINATVAMRKDLGQDDVGDDLMRELRANTARIFAAGEAEMTSQTDAQAVTANNS
jgi:hypothetical protein